MGEGVHFMNKRIILWSSIGVVVVLAAWFLLSHRSAPKYDFRFDTVSTGDLSAYVTATGTVNPVISVDVGTQVSGIVSKLYADFNSVVKKGQVIAQIDPTFLQQAVKDAQAGVEKARAQLEDSKRTFDREKALLAKGLDSQLNYDAALTTFQSNSASLKSAQATLDRARINLAYATIYAPIDGVVINRAVNVGQTVAASFSSPTLFTIANDLKKMQVLATVDESDVGQTSIGQEATFTVDAYPSDTFKGVISQIRLAPVTVQNVVNYNVVIDVNNDQLKLMPGMTANVRVLVASAHDVLRVSNLALRLQPPSDLVDSSRLRARKGPPAAAGNGTEDSTARAARYAPGSSAGIQSGGGGAAPAAPAQGAAQPSTRSAAPAAGTPAGAATSGAPPQDSTSSASRSKTIAGSPTSPAVSAQFGIVRRFPEFEKSAYKPSHQAERGRVWVLTTTGRLEPVYVRTGITDGRYTEVTGADLKPGEQVVVAASPRNAAAEQARSPLSGQGPMGRPGFR